MPAAKKMIRSSDLLRIAKFNQFCHEYLLPAVVALCQHIDDLARSRSVAAKLPT